MMQYNGCLPLECCNWDYAGGQSNEEKSGICQGNRRFRLHKTAIPA